MTLGEVSVNAELARRAEAVAETRGESLDEVIERTLRAYIAAPRELYVSDGD